MQKGQAGFGSTKVFLEDITDSGDPQCVLDEVKTIIRQTYPRLDFSAVRGVYRDVLRLYRGEYPGYGKCNTAYHDLRHTMDVFLALGRMLHGASLEGVRFDEDDVALALVSALLHDVGYIQAEGDTAGTGAKYTLTHVKRSMQFCLRYLPGRWHFAHEDAQKVSLLIAGTSLAAEPGKMPHASDDLRALGEMASMADLVGQLAERVYLEKLQLLYLEFVEGRVEGFVSEEDLYMKTVGFVEGVYSRITHPVEGTQSFLKTHFSNRCNIDRDLYSEAIKTNVDYLLELLSRDRGSYRDGLNRLKGLA